MSSLVNQYLTLLDLDVKKTSEIDHEDSISSVIYKIEPVDGSPLILKICFNDQRFNREVEYRKLLDGIIPIPKLVSAIEPKEGMRGAILVEYVDAQPLEIGDLTEQMAFSMGKLLGQLHQVPCKSEDFTFEVRKSSMKSLSECRGVISEDLLDRSENFFEANLKILEKVDGPCIIHRDYRPANVLAKDGKILSIIDWEIARVGFAEEDFASMDMLVWRKDRRSMESFLKGYASERAVPDLEAVLPFLRVVRTLGVLGFTIARKTFETTRKAIYNENLKLFENYV